MNITVKTITGGEINLDVKQDMCVEDVKKMIQEKEGLKVEEQRLITNGEQLENDKNLSDYNVKEGQLVFLVPRVRGG